MISIVIPVLNEESFIENLLYGLLLEEELISEIWVCDGGSVDRTKELVLNISENQSKVKYVFNQNKYVSHAFNLVYPSAKGEFIALLGAHAIYPSKFLSNGLSYLQSGEADVVGGPLLQKGKGAIGEAIALAMSSKFGVGDTEFRTSDKKQYVDSVAFAIYRKDILEQTGLFDTVLIRNQDDEFHYRIKSFGYRILMVPEMRCTYFVRESHKDLFIQYYQYGLFKPLVLYKLRSALRIRHLIPAFFILYLISLPLAMFTLFWILPVLLYLILNCWISMNSKTGIAVRLWMMLTFPILHIAYGLGFLKGLFIKWPTSHE